MAIIKQSWRNRLGLLFRLPDDVDALVRMVERLGAKLVVIDPSSEYLSMSYSANNDQHVRQAPELLTRMAQRQGGAVVLVCHLNKGGGTQAIQRGLESMGLSGLVRAQHLIVKHPDWTPEASRSRTCWCGASATMRPGSRRGLMSCTPRKARRCAEWSGPRRCPTTPTTCS